MLLDGVRVGGRDQLEHRVPVDSAEPTFAARALPTRALLRVGDERLPGLDGVVVLAARLAPQIQERPADVWVLNAQRAIEVPRERDSALTTSRLVGGNAGFEIGIVGLLHLPRDDAVLHMDSPAAPARAVHAMGAADDLVVLPAISIELLPTAGVGRDLVGDPGNLGHVAHSSVLSVRSHEGATHRAEAPSPQSVEQRERQGRAEESQQEEVQEGHRVVLVGLLRGLLEEGHQRQDLL